MARKKYHKGSDRYIVVASGPSAAGFVPPPGANVVAVNGAIDWLARADYWFTLDASPENLQRMNNPRQGVTYYAAILKHKQTPPHVIRQLRISLPRTRSRNEVHDTPTHWFERYGCIAKVSRDIRHIYTGNSAWGALQLAHLLGAKRVLLVGVDATQEPKVDGTVPNNLSHLPLLFAGAVGVIDFGNCGKMKVEGMPNFDTHAEGIAWLMS